MRASIDIETILTTVFVLIDDWFAEHGQAWRDAKPGQRPCFRDSEVLTLMLAQEFVPYPGETQFLAYIRGNHHALFPALLDQSQYNRRSKGLLPLLEPLRFYFLLAHLPAEVTHLVLDTKPIPVVGLKRSKARSDFAGSAAYGYCASRQMYYYGYKLVMLILPNGQPLVYDLVPANTDERVAATAILDRVRQADILADKGFIDAEWQDTIYQQTGNRIWTLKRRNQAAQNPSTLDYLIGRFRQQIESTFHALRNTGRDLERLLAKSVVGLCARVAAKLTAFALRSLLRSVHGIDIQTFSATV